MKIFVKRALVFVIAFLAFLGIARADGVCPYGQVLVSEVHKGRLCAFVSGKNDGGFLNKKISSNGNEGVVSYQNGYIVLDLSKLNLSDDDYEKFDNSISFSLNFSSGYGVVSILNGEVINYYFPDEMEGVASFASVDCKVGDSKNFDQNYYSYKFYNENGELVPEVTSKSLNGENVLNNDDSLAIVGYKVLGNKEDLEDTLITSEENRDNKPTNEVAEDNKTNDAFYIPYSYLLIASIVLLVVVIVFVILVISKDKKIKKLTKENIDK